MDKIKSKTSKYLNIVLWCVLAIWLAAQICTVVSVQDIPQTGDALRYQQLAEESLANDSWYPMQSHIEGEFYDGGHPTYICYPGYINLLEIYILIFGTIKAAFWFNILFNCLTALCIYKIIYCLAGLNRARLALCLFCLYPYQILLVGTTMSELPCIALTYLSILLVGDRRYGPLVVSAILMVAASYIRTVSLVFAIAALLYMIKNRYGIGRFSTYLASAAVCCFGIIMLNKSISGYAFYSSSTLGTNMMLGANDEADGMYNNATAAKEENEKKMEGMNVFQIDSLEKAYAVNWIKQHPGRWSALAFQKMRYQMYPDSYIHVGRDDYSILGQNNNQNGFILNVWRAYCWIYQILLIIFAIFGIWCRRHQLLRNDGIILLPFLGGLALAVLTVGHTRYNMPFIPILIYFAVWAISTNYKKLTTK